MKKILISILVSVFIISMAITVNAATGNVTLSASSDTVVKGNTFTVTLAGVSDTNILGIKGTLSFDSTKLKLESKEAGKNFTDASGTDSEIELLTAGTGDKSVTLSTYTFKVLDTADIGDTTIKISNITLAADTNLSVEETSVTVKIKADGTTADTPTNTPSGTTDGKDDSNNTTNNNNNTKTTGSTTKKKSLPQTGVETASIFVIVALGIVSIVSYISYKKYKNV